MSEEDVNLLRWAEKMEAAVDKVAWALAGGVIAALLFLIISVRLLTV